MSVLTTAIDPRSATYLKNRSIMLEHLRELTRTGMAGPAGGANGLSARDRVELLVDRDTPLLELSPTSALGTGYRADAGVISAIGVVEGRLCVIVADDDWTMDLGTPRLGTPQLSLHQAMRPPQLGASSFGTSNFGTADPETTNPYAVWKLRRATAIARANLVPLISLVRHRSPSVDPLFPGGTLCRDLAGLPGAGVTTIAVLFGEVTTGTAAIRDVAGHTIIVSDDPDPLRETASNCHVAESEPEAIELARMLIAQLVPNTNARRSAPRCPIDPPRYDPGELIAVAPADPLVPVEPREILARVLDGSRFEEFDQARGMMLCAGWGSIHGYPVAVISDCCGALARAEIDKAARFVRVIRDSGVALLLLRGACCSPQAGTGHAEYEPELTNGAIVALLADLAVPQLTLQIGAAPAGGDDPRFRFRWPGGRWDDPDDGVIDPRDTRTVLGLCLATVTAGLHRRSQWSTARGVPSPWPASGVFQIRGWQ